MCQPWVKVGVQRLVQGEASRSRNSWCLSFQTVLSLLGTKFELFLETFFHKMFGNNRRKLDFHPK